jgi:hypothetical protein
MNVMHVAHTHRDQFPPEFIDWLYDNQHIWVGFVSEASKVINAGFKHYSARTIVHVLRHHSALAERGGEWKINNNHSPYLGRLFALVYPQHEKLFEFRVTRANRGSHL